MDSWKLFALLVAFACLRCAEGAKKKIRIHLPQKVKHIHHHKKIYITNHPASSQYAPAFLPSAEGSASSVPVTNVLPLKSVGLYDDRLNVLNVAPSASKLLPLYKARGYYGPTPAYNDWEEEAELVPPPEPSGPGYDEPSAFSAPSAPAASAVYTPKRIKVIKIKESPRKKKIIRKRKPKRIIHEPPPVEDEHPVSTFHEQFYSDTEGAGTIKKIRKPKRIEKIIDGDTEHIHMYSEEHIHKVVFNDGSKLSDVAGGDPVASMSGHTAAHPLIPIKSHHSLRSPNEDREYASYQPHEVTHDHIFHDHGEIPPNMDLPRDSLGFPPRASYTSQGMKLAGERKRPFKHNYNRGVKAIRPATTDDFTYYENMYTTNGRPKKVVKPTKLFDDSNESTIDDYRPVPSFRPRPKVPNSPYYGKQRGGSKYNAQASIAVPYSTSSTIVHDNSEAFNGAKTTAASGFANFKDPFAALKGVYSNNYGYDTYAASANYLKGNGKHKSISTQNVSFGGQDHKTIVDHLAESSQINPTLQESTQSQMQEDEYEGDYENTKNFGPATPTSHYTITENSPTHEYFTAMAMKALQENPMTIAEASNNNFQFAEAPSSVATPTPTIEGMLATEDPRPFHRMQQLDNSNSEPTSYEPNNRNSKRSRLRNKMEVEEDVEAEEQGERRSPARYQRVRGRPLTKTQDQSGNSPAARGRFKYGDKI